MENRIRSAEDSDAPAIRDIYAPFVSDSAASFEADPPDAPTMAQRIRDIREKLPWLVFEGGGQVLGYAYASIHRARKAYQWCVEASVYVDGRARRRGVGRALYGSLFDLLRRQGYVNVYAGITLPNAPSVALHESFGFSTVGIYRGIGFKFGKWHDVVWLEHRLQDPAVPVPELIPAPKLLADPEVSSMLLDHARRAKAG